MHEVRELLEIGKGDAPPPGFAVDDIVAAGRRQRRRALAERIGGAGVLAAALVAVGLLVGNSIMPSSNRPITQSNRPAGQPVTPTIAIAPLTFTFDGYRAGAYRVLPPQ